MARTEIVVVDEGEEFDLPRGDEIASVRVIHVRAVRQVELVVIRRNTKAAE